MRKKKIMESMKFGVQPWSKNKISVYCHTFETKLLHSCPISV